MSNKPTGTSIVSKFQISLCVHGESSFGLEHFEAFHGTGDMFMYIKYKFFQDENFMLDWRQLLERCCLVHISLFFPCYFQNSNTKRAFACQKQSSNGQLKSLFSFFEFIVGRRVAKFFISKYLDYAQSFHTGSFDCCVILKLTMINNIFLQIIGPEEKCNWMM